MKQVLQNIANGETQLVEVPCPQPESGSVLIQSSRSLISAGTERMLIDFGKANWVQKARQQPDKVRMVLDKVRTDGLATTLEAVRAKLNQPLPIGYCNVGRVIEAGGTEFAAGDRVVSNGPHAEVVRVPQRLCARIPDNVEDDEAAFVVLGAIALQGIRLVQPSVGESVVVTGLGLIGLLAVQILRASGCRVLGVDMDSAKCELARQFGAEVVDLSRGEDPLAKANRFSRGRGVDAVLITASTSSNEPVSQGATMCRKRGRIVLVGVAGLELSRADFYEKELSFQVSCSYGPGRYDAEYEEKGHDYPVGFVRWTEQRNFEAVLDLLAAGALNVKPLISDRRPIAEALSAYEKLADSATLGVLLEYPQDELDLAVARTVSLGERPAATAAGTGVVCGVAGAGNYASRVLIPAFKAAGAELRTLVTDRGLSAADSGRKFGFMHASTDFETLCSDDAISTLVLATQHQLHGEQVCRGLRAGKHVFVEKPLALTKSELDDIEQAYRDAPGRPRLMVGYNRRFSPLTGAMRELLSRVDQPKVFVMTMNAGAIPADHWTQDPLRGGGRIIGEACHYIDLMRHLAGCPITGFSATQMGAAPGVAIREDKATITLSFEDGSFGTIHYLANGGKAFPKERIEVFANDAVLQLDNFRRLNGYGWRGFRGKRLYKQDKGQNACVRAFVEAIRSGAPAPIPFEELLEVGRVTLQVSDSLRAGR